MTRFQICVLLLALSISLLPAAHYQTEKANNREEAYRANNIGVALLEQFKHKEAADAFRRALQLEPGLATARINLGIALFNLPDLPAAQKELQAASAAAPSAPQPHYVLGLLAKTQNRPEEAIAAFQKVLRIDPNDVGANVNLGQLYAQQRKYAEAIAVLRTAIAAEPYNATALYNLGTALTRAGQRVEGQKVIAQFQELRQRGTGTTLGTNYLEQGRYAEAIASTGAEPGLVDKRTPEVVFRDATTTVIPSSGWRVPAPLNQRNSGAALLFDYDLDGDLDLFEVSGTKQRLCRNDGGKFTDVTSQAGALGKEASGPGTAAIAGDYDNDNRPDLFVLRSGTSTLYHNDGNGSFSDVTAAAKILVAPEQATTTAFLDVDHDGDLDILIGGEGYLLLRNNGDRTFSDQTSAAKLVDKVLVRSIVATDFDNRRDIDLLVASDEKISLWRNMRDGTFRDIAAEVGLSAAELKGKTTIAAGDVNKDGFTDFYFGSPGDPAGFVALSTGTERFRLSRVPGKSSASQFIDYDNDGLLDLISISLTQLTVLRNTGEPWTDAPSKPALEIAATVPSVLASGDIDGDGDTDVIFGVPGALSAALNDGGSSNRSLRINLAGRVSNRSAVGAKIELRAGSLAQKLETYSASPAPAPADILFGLGKRTTVDAVRVLWPAGIVQAETELANTKSPLTLTELDRKPSSCPYLYAWNGERFEFITDFLGGGEMGHLDAPGIYNTPDADEYVRIRSDQLRERNGRYELRVTNELEEALFVDKLQLLSVDHPAGTEIYPNEGLTVPPQPFKIHPAARARAPVAAFDEHGHDVLSRIARLDREYPDDFKLQPIRGYADHHELTLKLDPDLPARGGLLLLTGWTDYAWSSDNLAASQSGKSLTLPALQVKDKRGRWKTVIENIGIPVGRPQTVVVDLAGKFLSADRDVRIVTNMRIYWDQILVANSAPSPMRLMRLDPTVANLRWRGFSLEHSPDGRQPMSYDYNKVSFTSPWKVMVGRYTRVGDVRLLLSASDDMFVISKPGDELMLSFAADKLPPLAKGWTRTFLLYADGFSKEMDINSASPDQVGPLPFHGMKKYPYTWPERYPLTEKRRRYLEEWNTRVVTSPIPDMITGFTGLTGFTESEGGHK